MAQPEITEETLREVDRKEKELLPPRGQDACYPSESQSTKRRLQAGQESANPVLRRCPLCHEPLDVVDGLCDSPSCRAYRRKRCDFCYLERKNFVPPGEDMCEECAAELV